MKKMQSQPTAVLLSTFCLSVAAICCVGAKAQPEDAPGTPEITIAINTFKRVFRQSEPVRVGVAIVNNGKETVCIPAMAGIGVSLHDAAGRKMRSGPIPTPPIAPPYHWMERDGKEIYMQPVWALPPGAGRVFIAEDVLKYYHLNTSEGIYTFHCPAKSFARRHASDLVVREGLPERLWVPGTPITDYVPVFRSNTVEIRIEEPNQ